MNTSSSTLSPRLASCAVWLGFAFIYFAWGGTYLGVKFALTNLPIFLMSGSRFLIAGLLLLVGIAWFDPAGFRRGTLKEWKDAAIIGLLLLVLGIGTGNWVQQYVDSSFAAMVFSGIPLWTILVDWIRPGGQPPTRMVAFGLLLGFAGIGLILFPTGNVPGGTSHLLLNLILVLASICWASGAIFSRHHQAHGSALLPVARQMIIAGTILLLIGSVRGDFARLDLLHTQFVAWLGYTYLVFIGSLGGYPVYIWLMRVCPPSKAATIPYMNLLVAVFLGWSLGREAITARLLGGTLLVLISVATVLRSKAEDILPPGD